MKHVAVALGAVLTLILIVALVLVRVGYGRFMPVPKPVDGQPAATDRAAPDATSAERADAPLQPPAAQVRFHGGRTAAWWKERLEVLQRQGPPALYQLALQRAGAAGLRVVEGPPLTVSEIEVPR